MCIACRQSEHDVAIPGERSDSEQLLSAVLKSNRGLPEPADDGATATDDADVSTLVPEDSRQQPARKSARAEQIVLREVDPARAADATATRPRRSMPDTSITASLLEAFTDGTDQKSPRTPATRPEQSGAMSPHDTSGVVDITDARPVSAPREPPGRPRPGDGEIATAPEDADPVQSDAAPDDADRTDPADDAGPADTEHTDAADTDDAEQPDDAKPAADDTDDTEPADTDDTEPSDHAEQPDDAEPADTELAEPPDATKPSATDHAETADDTERASDGGTRPPDETKDARGAVAEPANNRESLRTRLRTTFREMGAWTAVAQVGLLITGLLCVFQVVVLLVVLRFLLQAPVQGTDADMLEAHGRATNVMVPVLVTVALAAAALAIWSVRRSVRDQPSGAKALGVPISLWAMIAAAGAVAAVVIADTSSTVEQASRMTLLAVAGCALLGAAAFLAPRGIATPHEDHQAAPDAGDPTTPGDDDAQADSHATGPDDSDAVVPAEQSDQHDFEDREAAGDKATAADDESPAAADGHATAADHGDTAAADVPGPAEDDSPPSHSDHPDTPGRTRPDDRARRAQDVSAV